MRCRPPRPEDLPVLELLRNDLPTQYALLAAPRPNSRADVVAWLERRASESDTLFWVLANERDEGIGFAQIVKIDAANGHGAFGIALAPAARGKGYARAAIEAVCALAAGDGRLRKLVLEVSTANVVARALYTSSAFREVGVLRRHYRAPSGWQDVAIMERFLPDPAP